MVFMCKENLINKNLPKYIIGILISIYVGAIFFSIISITIYDIINNNAKNIFCTIFSGNYGLVYYGGLTGIVLTTCVFVKKNIISMKIYNILAFIIPFFHAISRIGCYFAGCCYGIHNEIFFELPYFSNGSFTGEYRVPIQIYEAIFEFVLAISIFIIYLKNKYKYNLLKLYLIMYSVFRFLFEFFRDDVIRGVYFGFSFSQYISFFIILLLIFQKSIKHYRRIHNEYT